MSTVVSGTETSRAVGLSRLVFNSTTTQMEYSEKLKDPRWQKIRLQVFERDTWDCQHCFRGDLTLHVHHLYYQRGKEPWEYPLEAFKTLCEDCHEAETKNRPAAERMLLDAIRRQGFSHKDVLEMAAGFAVMPMVHIEEVVALSIKDSLTNYVTQKALQELSFLDVELKELALNEILRAVQLYYAKRFAKIS